MVGVVPGGLNINKTPFISFENKGIKALWEETINNTEESLLETLLIGISSKLFDFENNFWKIFKQTENDLSEDDFLSWWVKLMNYLQKLEKRLIKKKRQKLKTSLKDNSLKLERGLDLFQEHQASFYFKLDLDKFSKNITPDFDNCFTLMTLDNSPTTDETLNGTEEPPEAVQIDK